MLSGVMVKSSGLSTKKLQYNNNLQPFSYFVDQILTAKQQPPSSPFSKGELPIADIFVLEKQIDDMVYALYGLTPEEIAIVEGKGFDRTNISKMRAFYLAYPIVDALRPQLTCNHYNDLVS